MLFLCSAARCLNTSMEWAEACKGFGGGPKLYQDSKGEAGSQGAV